MGLQWHKELTLDTFGEFAQETIADLYLHAYSATVNRKKTERLCVDALCKVFANRAALYSSEETFTAAEAADRALKSLASRTERERMNNELFQLGRDRLPGDDVLGELVARAVRKAEIQMPRYAPTFTGVRGTLYIMSMVVCIILVIALVWINPFAAHQGGDTELSGVSASSAERLNVSLLADADTEICGVESGSVPVKLRITGPDAGAVASVSVYRGLFSEPLPYYNCNGEYYCFVADNADIYRIMLSDAYGQTVNRYISVESIVSPTDLRQTYYAFAHDRECAMEIAAEGGERRVVAVQPEHGSISEDEDGGLVFTPDKGYVGIDSFTVSAEDGSEKSTLPILVVNSAPYYDPSLLTSEVLHTPTVKGTAIGKLSGLDLDCDELTYSLVESSGCTVVLAPNGGYLARINDDAQGDTETASFTFTVSDGLLVSQPYTMTLVLKNNLIAQTEFSQTVYCYSGEAGFYTLELPKTDDDGDPLTWSVLTAMTGGRTAQGSEVSIGPNKRTVLYKLDPARNDAGSELIELVCSDGWAQSEVISFYCIIQPNSGPVAGEGNHTVLPEGEDKAVCEVKLLQECPFSSYEITAVSAVGGTVEPDTGWKNLQFTFTLDYTSKNGTASVTVSDVLTGQSVVIVYTVSR